MYVCTCVHLAVKCGLFHHGQRLTIPTSCPEGFADLMRTCWQLDPVMRPTFRELLTYIDKMFDDDDLRLTTQSFLKHKKEWRYSLIYHQLIT